MKKVFLTASLAAIGLAFTAFIAPKTSVDTDFEGVITYSISVDNPQYQSMMQGSTQKTYIKGGKSKTFSDMGMSKYTVFSDHNTPDDPIILIEVMGNKYQLKNDKTKKPADPVIKYTDETKTIAGYNCHKAEVTTTDEQGKTFTTNVYYTEDITTSTSRIMFKGLKGFPLEFSRQQQGMNFSYSATSVTKQSVSDDTFTVPTGYKLMTKEEMSADIQKNMSGGGGGGN